MAASAALRKAAHEEIPAQASDPVAAARAAGLRHVDDHRFPGLARRPTGRKIRQGGHRWTPEFAIYDPRGQRVRDHATLERVRKLAIPPAWRDVWICPVPEGHLQANGRDARGRKQYRYHPRWREERDGNKYFRMIALGRAIPALRRRVAADLRLHGLPKRKVVATVVRLLETTLIRVGNEEYARANRSFGLTTLQDQHVRVGRSQVSFRFRGKSRVFHQISIHDPTIARIVRRCRDIPGQELFQYIEPDGQRAEIDSADVNAYIREATGQDFTAKDFRTWAGTVLAAVTLAEMTAAGAQRGGRPARPTNRDVVRAIAQVAERLGNTPTVCRKCYVHPDVVASFLDGSLVAAMAPARGARASRAPTTVLRPEENAVLELLRRRVREEKNGGALARQLRRSLRLVRGGKGAGRGRA